MTIDEVIKEIELEFNTFLSETGMDTSDAIKHEQTTNVDFDKVYTANKIAIDILRKYQKIRTEIEQTTSRYCISRERGGSGQVEWSDRLIKESEVLEILDKWKVSKK